MQMENNVFVQHQGRDPSDHAPLLISKSTRLDNKLKPFRFLNVWASKQGFLDVVEESWSQFFTSSPLRILSDKLRNVKQALKQWSTDSFRGIFLAVQKVEQEVLEVEMAYDNNLTDLFLVDLQESHARLRQTLVIEEGF